MTSAAPWVSENVRYTRLAKCVGNYFDVIAGEATTKPRYASSGQHSSSMVRPVLLLRYMNFKKADSVYTNYKETIYVIKGTHIL